MIGSSILTQKLNKDFEVELAIKDEHILELRDKIFTLLRQGSEDGIHYSKLVLENLSLSVANVAIHTTNSCWQSSVKDLVDFGLNNSPRECFIALNILKNICVTHFTKVFNQKTTQLLKRYLNENVGAVLDMLAQILSQGGNGQLPHEVYLECFSVAKYWCEFSKKSFVINRQLVDVLFTLLHSEPSVKILKKVIKVLIKILSTNQHVKALSNYRFEQATHPDFLPPQDLAFLNQLVDYLYSQREKYSEATRLNFSHDDEDEVNADKAVFASKFTALLLAVA
mmetsp:Transcript_1199/g.2192  ORF Transcript_1199/g.2192 Transcript_1199/m.2192 type:complete len:282 (+) Transcript_1199:199-1044(+)